MTEIAYICTTCGTKHIRQQGVEAIAYLVMGPDGVYTPTCSTKCAALSKEKKINALKEKISKIESASIEKLAL